MAENNKNKNIQLEGGTYEIIRNRLNKQGQELQQRLNQLNAERKKVFGAIETKLIANDRINTTNNCVARDMIAIGDTCIFGYNVHLGLRSGIKLEDVFSVYVFRDGHFHQRNLDFLRAADKKFETDFTNLYRYYKQTKFTKFAVIGTYLYMVFQVSASITDIKTFKWLIKDDQLIYQDNRSDHEFRFPNQHEFQWKRATRDMQRGGKHPHVSILERVFVETVGGDLTIKIEDNTDDGLGIYREEVQYKDQTLDDAEYFYAELGHLIALRIRPYQEDYRYFMYNEKIQEVVRLDSLADAAVLLPDDHGIIFSNGYYLQTGEYKIFDVNRRNKQFERRIPSPNGEDHFFVFYNQEYGRYVLMSYNMIEQAVDTPILCHGYCLFPNGELAYFKSEDSATKHHVIQIWQTAYMAGDLMPSEHTDSYLYKVGNKDIVRGMAECHELLVLLNKEDSYSGLYLDLVQKSTDILDSYYWINHTDTFRLDEPLQAIKASANAAIEEYEKVQRIKKGTKEAITRVHEKAKSVFDYIAKTNFDSVDIFVEFLAQLRILRGEIISLKDLRYTNLPLIEELETEATENTDRLSEGCVQFLLEENALQPYLDKVETSRGSIDQVTTALEGTKVGESIDQIGEDLKLLIDIVSNLKIEDATQTTRIIDNISDIYATLNQVKAALKRKQKSLRSTEAIAEFAAQLKLLDQGIINYLDISDSPAKCDEYLTKLMVQLEEVEGKFAEFDEFIPKVAEKREEIYNAFETRKLNLIEARNKRAAALQAAAERILNGIKNRIGNLDEVAAINGFFAADLMIDKVRDIIQQLNGLEDNIKADDIQAKLKTIKEDAIRQLRDKQDLFVGGENVIKFGRHHFSVNTQPLDLTIINRGGTMYYHLTGTNFFEEVTDEAFLKTKAVWEQPLVSENQSVYRGEYLAYQVLKDIDNQNDALLHEMDRPALFQYIQKFAASRYHEGYTKGIHDEDATTIALELLTISKRIDLLRYPPTVRACGQLFWSQFLATEEKNLLNAQLKSAGTILQVFPDTQEFDYLKVALSKSLTQFLEQTQLFDASIATQVAAYLFEELSRGDTFVISKEAGELHEEFLNYLKQKKAIKAYQDSIQRLKAHPEAQYLLVQRWVQAFIGQLRIDHYLAFLEETATILYLNAFRYDLLIDTTMRVELTGLHGSHSILEEDRYVLDYNAYMSKMMDYEQVVVPRFHAYHELKKQLLEDFRETLRLNEFKPRVLSSFVRNKLIDTLYLPIFGDNLAKQIGTVGANTRTDRMGMLLLISPPGYGKTTLMEYVANRLGLIFMKINGPAIGHHVISLDPTEADNAAARQELKKLNLALEMGDNIMLYLDDIQHCNPEFLQKFISLTDAQRKIEGVYQGKTKTYDLRGKKVCVVMAGNPYTESGEKFQIPDMLANRSDIYNLGDIIGDTKDVFELSYIENSLTSNPVLQKLAAKSLKDVYAVLQLAQTNSREGLEFEASHSSEELNEYVNVLNKMLVVRDAVLNVNLQYIASAAIADEYRTEPPFLLQGSYRNMNKLAEKVVPIMNDSELRTLLLSHYEGESQTLTTGAEANMLKFKHLMNWQTPEEAKRWEQIKRAFNKNKVLRGLDASDSMVQVIAQLSEFSDGLEGIKQILQKGVLGKDNAVTTDPFKQVVTEMRLFTEGLVGIQAVIKEGLESGVVAQQSQKKSGGIKFRKG